MNGRHHLPWRKTRSTYRILVSEFMLQQTQVERVLEKYNEFVKIFPTFRSLNSARLSEVLQVWQGLGYNRRALLLKRCAYEIITNHKGRLPRETGILEKLPGIGNTTAAAVTAFVYNSPSILIETNIRTVYFHFFFRNRKKVHDEDLYKIVGLTLDKTNPREWYYALMDYGAMLKRSGINLNRKSAHYAKQSRFNGSTRQIRGKIIRMLVTNGSLSIANLQHDLKLTNSRISRILQTLIKDGLIIIHGDTILLG
jgi:A/G-specific adenine glycosylase